MTVAAIDERFRYHAEDRAVQQGRPLVYDDIGEKLMELRKVAWDRYDLKALWNIPGHATLEAMRSVAHALRGRGDLAAVHLAAAILDEVDRQECDAVR